MKFRKAGFVAMLAALVWLGCSCLCETKDAPKLVIGFGGFHEITDIDVSPDSRYLVSASVGDGSIRLWELASGRLVGAFKIPRGKWEFIVKVAYDPLGRYVLGATNGDQLMLFDKTTGEQVWSKSKKMDWSESLVFSPNGQYFVAEGWDRSLTLYNTDTGSVEARSPQWQGNFNSDGSPILCGDAACLKRYKNQKAIYDPEKGRFLAQSPDGKKSVMGKQHWSEFPFAYVFTLVDAVKGIPMDWYAAPVNDESESILKAIFTPDGEHLLLMYYHEFEGYYDSSGLVLWDTAQNGTIKELEGHLTNEGLSLATAIAVTPDGRYALSGGLDGIIIVWDVSTGERVRELPSEGAKPFRTVSVSEDGDSIYFGGEAGIWRWELGSAPRLLAVRVESNAAIAFSPDGGYAAVGNQDCSCSIWDLRTEAEVHRFPGDAYRVTALSISNDNLFAVVADSGGRVLFYDFAHGSILGESTLDNLEEIYTNGLLDVEITKDSKYIIGGGWEYKLWEAGTWRTLAADRMKLPDHVTTVAAVPESSKALLGKTGGEVVVWDFIQGTEETLGLPGTFVKALAASPDGRFAASGDSKGFITAWDMKTGFSIPLGCHDSGVLDLSFVRDGAILVSTSIDGTIRFWDVAKAELLATAVMYSNGGWAVAAPNGRYDSDDPEEVPGFSWFDSHDSMTPLPMKTVKNRYYEPGLLARVLAEVEPFPAGNATLPSSIQQ